MMFFLSYTVVDILSMSPKVWERNPRVIVINTYDADQYIDVFIMCHLAQASFC